MSEKNKVVVRRLYEQAINKNRTDLLDRLCSKNLVLHGAPSGMPTGLKGLKETIATFRSAFPDLRITVDDVISEGDKVATRFTFSGTHKGKFLAIEPTGKSVMTTAMSISRIRDQKIIEYWVNRDDLGLLQQLDSTWKLR